MPYLEVVIDEKLQFTIIVFGWLLPNCHALYENHSRSVQAVTVSNLLREIMNHELCPELPLEPKAMQGDKVKLHVIPCRIDLKSQQHLPVSTKMFSRDERCAVLCMDSNICCKCRSLLKKIETKKSNVKPLPKFAIVKCKSRTSY